MADTVEPKAADHIKVDYDRVSILLDVVNKAASAGPIYNSIVAAAGMELKDINDEIAVGMTKVTKARTAKEAKAKADAKAQAEAAVVLAAKAEEDAKAKAEADAVAKAKAIAKPDSSATPSSFFSGAPKNVK